VEKFISGSISLESLIRPNKIFTADKDIILYKIGHLSNTKIAEVINSIVSLLQK